MNILVTGANGFVGLHLCQLLLNAGHTVYAVVRKKSNMPITHGSLHIVEGSVDQNLNWMDNVLSKVDTFIHTAGIVHSYNNDDFFRVNSFATEQILEKINALNPKLHFILISSLAAAGPSIGEDARTEEDILLPISAYGKSKKLAEEMLSKFPHIASSIIRPPMVIGPRDSAVLDIYKMVKSRIIVLPGMNSKKKLYSFVCVFDLIKTIELVATTKTQGTFYSASPQIITFQEMIQKINQLFGNRFIIYLPLPLFLTKFAANLLKFFYFFKKHNLRLTPDKYYELAAENFTCNAQKSRDMLGQKYQYDIDKTLKVTFEDYKKRGWL